MFNTKKTEESQHDIGNQITAHQESNVFQSTSVNIQKDITNVFCKIKNEEISKNFEKQQNPEKNQENFKLLLNNGKILNKWSPKQIKNNLIIFSHEKDIDCIAMMPDNKFFFVSLKNCCYVYKQNINSYRAVRYN